MSFSHYWLPALLTRVHSVLGVDPECRSSMFWCLRAAHFLFHSSSLTHIGWSLANTSNLTKHGRAEPDFPHGCKWQYFRIKENIVKEWTKTWKYNYFWHFLITKMSLFLFIAVLCVDELNSSFMSGFIFTTGQFLVEIQKTLCLSYLYIC